MSQFPHSLGLNETLIKDHIVSHVTYDLVLVLHSYAMRQTFQGTASNWSKIANYYLLHNLLHSFRPKRL